VKEGARVAVVAVSVQMMQVPKVARQAMATLLSLLLLPPALILASTVLRRVLLRMAPLPPFV